MFSCTCRYRASGLRLQAAQGYGDCVEETLNMTEASGKRNYMFADRNTFKAPYWLILFSAFVCMSHSSAQQQAKTIESSRSASTESSESPDKRRIERLGEVTTDEWQMDLALPRAAPVISPDNGGFVLLDEDQNQRLRQLLSTLATNPGDTEILAQLNALLTDVLAQANSMMDAGFIEQARQLLPLIQSINPGLDGLSSANARLQIINEVSELLMAGNTALEHQRIVQPENSNALYYFNQAFDKDPQNRLVQQALARVQDVLIESALESARELDFETATAWLSQAAVVREDQKRVEEARNEVAKIEQEHAAELEQKAIVAMDSGDFILADFNIIDLIALGGQQARVEFLRARLKEARFYGGFEPGQIISDKLVRIGGKAPEIVIIAAGSFLMGSDDGYDNEKPQHRVTIEKGFGLGVREVTVAEFRLFIEHTGYQTAAEQSGRSSIYDEAAGRLNNREGVNWEYDYKGKKANPDKPVLHVNVHDALAYVQWLARETGKGYRLPSEAEYEYVASAGGKGAYWWGDGSPSEVVENLTGDRDNSPNKRQWTTGFKKYGDGHWGPAPAGSIVNDKKVHPMGVYDITGNVSEWTEDCWHHNYIKAPVDGSAWINPGCERRVARGGYWASSPRQTRAAFRISAKAETYGPVVGIRIARDL